MRLLVLLMLVVLPMSASANDDDPGGVLNPDEMSLSSALQKAINGNVDMVICSQGYLMTKQGNHAEARRVFENCSRAGYTGTMTWMSYMEQNGFGAEEDARKSVEWDRKAAELGDPIAKFNYGLNLLRGYGIKADIELGKAYIDEAARNGVEAAKDVQGADYDPGVATPDADNWKFEKRVF